MSVLITGAGGFLGTHLLRAFAAALPDVAIHAADLAPPASEHRAVVAHALDVSDAAAVADLVARTQPRFVVHAAAITPNAPMEAADAPRIIAVNIGGAANLLHAALALPGLQRAVFVSSGAVYGNAPDLPRPLTEDTPAAPTTLYGIAKFAGEGIARRLAALHGTSCISVRLTSLYGSAERPSAHRPRTSEIHVLRQALQLGRPIATTPTETLRDWTDADDAADAICRLATAPRLAHDLYNVGAGEALTWAATLALFQRRGLRVLPEGSADARHLAPPTPRPPLSIARLVADTGSHPARRLVAA